MTTKYNVQFQNISKTFGSTKVLESLSLNVHKGEFLSLLGPSGCGKSTSLNILAGFLKPDKGDVVINGNSIVKIPVHRRGLGMVFQRYTLFPHMNIYNNIAFGLKQRRVKNEEIRRKITEVLDLVGLSHVEERFPAELSGGQQQRIALARALVVEPEILLLDEPLSSLDAKMRRYMQVELRRIHDELGLTSIYVTHDQEEAFVMSDRIALMNEGNIEQLDSPEAIYDSPRTRFVAEFIGSSNTLTGKVVDYRDGLIEIELPENIKLLAYSNRQRVNPSIGETVDIAIREEHIEINNSEEKDNAISAIVSRVIYQGATIRYLCQIGDTQDTQVWVQHLTHEMEYDVGDKIMIYPKSENIRILEG